MPRTFDVAVIAGDGIGPEVTREAIRAVEAAATRSDAVFQWSGYPWGTDYYLVHGRMAPDDFLDALPPHPAVVLIEPRADLVGARPLLLRTADLRRRLRLLLGARDPASKRVNLREYAAGVRYRITGSAFEQALVQWQHACTLWPRAYRERLRLRPPNLLRRRCSSPSTTRP